MRSSAFTGRKPWRKFRRTRRCDAIVRKICCALLILEAAVLVERGGMKDLLALRVERQQREWISPAEDERDAAGLPEQIFGVRLRLRDGAVEFYRREHISEGAH